MTTPYRVEVAILYYVELPRSRCTRQLANTAEGDTNGMGAHGERAEGRMVRKGRDREVACQGVGCYGKG